MLETRNMKQPASLMSLFAFLYWLSITKAQERAPHGLVNESPIAFSPQAYDFFHPNAQTPSSRTPFDVESRSPLPLAATVQSDAARESKSSTTEADQKTGLGAGGIAGIVLGLTFSVISAMGVYYVLITRRNNLNRTRSAQPAPLQAV